jgi:hypothetical protein
MKLPSMRIALVAATALLSCGPGQRSNVVPDSGAPLDAPASRDTLLVADAGLSSEEFLSTYCATLAPCCARLALPTDGAACRAAAPSAPFRASMATDCLGALRASSDTCAHPLPPACGRAFTVAAASKRLGEPCATTQECLLSPQGPVTCAGAGLPSARCQVALAGKEGDGPCVGTVDGPLTVPAADPAAGSLKGYLCAVADGLWCDEASAKCAQTKPAGAPCVSFGECGPGRYCEDASGKCAARKNLGATCAVDEECPSAICGEDNKCAGPPLLDAAVARLCTSP